MSLRSRFWDFILKRMLVTYLTLIPSFFLAVISLSFLSIGILVIQVILILIGTYAMFRKYEQEKAHEKLIEEEKFTKKLQVFLEEFEDRIGSSGYGYSLLNIAFRIANDKTIQERTKAWSFLLHSVLDDLTKKTSSLKEKLKQGTTFSIAFKEFQNLLFLLRDFTTHFYNMVEETKQVKDFSQDTDFQKIYYKRLHGEFNNYMDRLSSFSDDLKAEFNLRLTKDSIKHLKDLDELYKS